MIGIIGAMEEEVAALKEAMEINKDTNAVFAVMVAVCPRFDQAAVKDEMNKAIEEYKICITIYFSFTENTIIKLILLNFFKCVPHLFH